MSGIIRILLSRDDWYHQRGYWVVANALKNAGLEVILGGIQTPAEIARTAMTEDVDMIGYRIMQASAPMVIQKLFQEMAARGIEDIPVVVGGIISDKDEARIKEMGVRAVFHSFDRLEDISRQLLSIVSKQTS
jgi:methylmalonyl-CoA mutase cobalamin-binding domain/chain